MNANKLKLMEKSITKAKIELDKVITYSLTYTTKSLFPLWLSNVLVLITIILSFTVSISFSYLIIPVFINFIYTLIKKKNYLLVLLEESFYLIQVTGVNFDFMQSNNFSYNLIKIDKAKDNSYLAILNDKLEFNGIGFYKPTGETLNKFNIQEFCKNKNKTI